MTDILKCAWLINDKGGRCGVEPRYESFNLPHHHAFQCPQGHGRTFKYRDRDIATAEWNRNQEALLGGDYRADNLALRQRIERLISGDEIESDRLTETDHLLVNALAERDALKVEAEDRLQDLWAQKIEHEKGKLDE